jgi:DNA-binding GntR family transcriptional regulator
MSSATAGTRKDAVLRKLRDEIVSSQLTPGTVLKDAEVAARLGVSITPVREAIGQLAAEGLIDIAPNRTRHVTHVTQKNTLELIDVMCLLACAGFEWGMENLSDAHLTTLRRQYQDFDSNLKLGNITAAAGAGADFSTTVILASGNRELQTHIDLVVTRTLRVLALTAESEVWQVWLDGYRETLAFLEAGEHAAALERYRQIYVDYRTCVSALLWDSADRERPPCA